MAGQVLVTPMHGLSVTTQVAEAVAWIGVPQGDVPTAVTVSGKLPQVLVTDLVRVADPLGAKLATVPIDP